VALTPDQWLNRLTKQMDDRSTRLQLLRSYMEGNAPLPEGAEGCRESYQSFQKKARTNFGELIVEAVVERMVVGGFRVGDDNKDDDEARRIWKRSRMVAGSTDVHRDMVGLSAGYVMLGGDKGAATITWERPEQVIVEHDARRPDLRRAAAKVYRDELEERDVALLHLPGWMVTFYRPLRDIWNAPTNHLRAQGGWVLDDAKETGLSFVPVYAHVNRGGLGEFETHTDLLDRINWGILQRLVITAMQAYRQRATKGDLPDEDDDGNAIDYGDLFRPGPGSLWQLPEGVELWESAPTDLSGILAGSKADLQHLAGVTRTPMSMLMPEGENQSAEGARGIKDGLANKAKDRIARTLWGEVMAGALAIERGETDPVPDVEARFLPAEQQSLSDRADASTKAQDIPWRARMEHIWQFDGDEIDRMETMRASDLLMQTSLTSSPVSPASPGDVSTP
jgi:Phage portal protein, SPP1 Gp6-like.